MEQRSASKNKDRSQIAAGLILVGVGATWLLRSIGYFIPDWLFSWPMILVIVGIYSGIKHNFRNNTWLVLIGLGGFFLLDEYTDLRLEPAFWPIALIALGILFILRPAKKKFTGSTNTETGKITETFTDTDTWSSGADAESNKYDYLRVDSVFSGVNRAIISKNFKGGKVSCVFGGAEVDLTRADISGNVVLKIDVVFGGAKILVPANWTVVNEVQGVFQNVDDKRKYNAAVSEDPGKVFILKGSAVFGGVEIRSY